MSSAEVQRGLLANCVASRVKVLDDPGHRKLIWWLQKRSWEPGGLNKLAEDIITRFPERFATPAMQRQGVEKGRIYSAEEVRIARKEIKQGPGFLLRGECNSWRGFPILVKDEDSEDAMSALLDREDTPGDCRRRGERRERAHSHPLSYPASAFVDACMERARRHLGDFLFQELCLNPAVRLDDDTLWYLPRLVETLAEMCAADAAEASNGAPVTQIGSVIHETLDYALEERCLVVIDGLARAGKTFAVQAWVDARAGEARYVQVPSSNDDMSFFRAVADALGLGSSHAYKAHELRRRIEDVLQDGDLLLVLDEGHYLWPQRNMRKASPHRINWLLTQLVNLGVPVAIVTTPQFTKSQQALEKSGGWSSEQFIGRIGDYQRLADSLCEADLEAVARHWLPGGDEKAIRVLVTYAQSSEKYLQGIESLARRARFLAKKAGRAQPTFQDAAAALKEGVVPSDNALAAALAVSGKTGPAARSRKQSATALRPVSIEDAEPLPEPCGRAIRPAKSTSLPASSRHPGASLLPH